MYKRFVIGVLAVLTTVTQAAVTDAANIKVLSSTAMIAGMEEPAPQFERGTEHKVTVDFASAEV
jgi:ABC-type molybdate transport system substrate-binding protein